MTSSPQTVTWSLQRLPLIAQVQAFAVWIECVLKMNILLFIPEEEEEGQAASADEEEMVFIPSPQSPADVHPGKSAPGVSMVIRGTWMCQVTSAGAPPRFFR